MLKVCEAVLFMACSKGCWGVCSSVAAEEVFGREARLRGIGASAGRADVQRCARCLALAVGRFQGGRGEGRCQVPGRGRASCGRNAVRVVGVQGDSLLSLGATSVGAAAGGVCVACSTTTTTAQAVKQQHFLAGGGRGSGSGNYWTGSVHSGVGCGRGGRAVRWVWVWVWVRLTMVSVINNKSVQVQ